MVTELELKFRIDDPDRVRARLDELGFSKRTEADQVDTYFVYEKKFGDGTWHYCRVREASDDVFSYSIAHSALETEEVETSVDNPDAVKRIMRELGFDKQAVVDKRRETYRNDELVVVLDHVDRLGWFVEVELLDTYSRENEKRLQALAGRLGLHLNNRVEAGYPRLLDDV